MNLLPDGYGAGLMGAGRIVLTGENAGPGGSLGRIDAKVSLVQVMPIRRLGEN